MISLFGLAYRRPDYVKKSLDSLVDNASEPINIYVAENKSTRSLEVQDLLRTYVDSGKIKAALFFEENTIGHGFCEMFSKFTPEEDLFLMTDLDLIVPPGTDYIKMIRDKHAGGAVLTGCTLDISNYTNTPNHGYDGDNDGFGMWLMGLKTSIFHEYPYRTNPPVDHIVRAHYAERGSVEKMLDIRLYHLAWDLWKDDPEYFKYKKDVPGWCYGGRPANMKYELYE